MEGFAARVDALDVSLFDGVPSGTSTADRRSLLAIQRAVRRHGPFSYLEIGSALGGTLRPYVADPRCRSVYTIDPRPSATPDERGKLFFEPDNSYDRMIEALRAVLPDMDVLKIVEFESDASDPRLHRAVNSVARATVLRVRRPPS